jgi:hypothetical protein
MVTDAWLWGLKDQTRSIDGGEDWVTFELDLVSSPRGRDEGVEVSVVSNQGPEAEYGETRGAREGAELDWGWLGGL